MYCFISVIENSDSEKEGKPSLDDKDLEPMEVVGDKKVKRKRGDFPVWYSNHKIKKIKKRNAKNKIKRIKKAKQEKKKKSRRNF